MKTIDLDEIETHLDKYVALEEYVMWLTGDAVGSGVPTSEVIRLGKLVLEDHEKFAKELEFVKNEY